MIPTVNVAIFDKIPRDIPQLEKRKRFLELCRKHCWEEPHDAVRIINDSYRSDDARMNFTAPYARVTSRVFKPAYTPKQMLAMGVFEGRYLNNLFAAFPLDWWLDARVSIHTPDVTCNRFKAKARKPLSYWREKRWVNEHDPRGWFEWYCFYFMGRRVPDYDDHQIQRWVNFVRHQKRLDGLLDRSPPDRRNDPSLYPRMRQTVLQWSYDARIATDLS